MVNPYINQPNYTNVMAQGLTTRLGYEKAKPKFTPKSRKGGGGGKAAFKKPGAPFSPERRAYDRAVDRQEESENILLEKGKADVEKTKSETKTNALKAVSDVKKSEAEVLESKQKRTTKGLQNMGSYATLLTKKNYRGYYGWVKDTPNAAVLVDMLTHPDEVDTYTEEQAQSYFGKIGELKKVDSKTVDGAIKHSERVAKVEAAALKAKANVVKQDKTEKGKDKRQDSKNLRIDEKALTDAELQITGEDTEGNSFINDKSGSASYVEQYNNLAERLNTGYKYIWSDEDDAVETSGKYYGTNKGPGYIKVKVEEEIAKVPPPPLPVNTNTPVEITTQEDYDALPSGTVYLENGQQYRKP